jgi:hypothetical protein
MLRPSYRPLGPMFQYFAVAEGGATRFRITPEYNCLRGALRFSLIRTVRGLVLRGNVVFSSGMTMLV